MSSRKRGGLFAAKLSVVDGAVAAVLTGDHYENTKGDPFPHLLGQALRDAISEHGSPVYPVPDSVVEAAVAAMRRAPSSGLSKCQDGEKGKACGHCPECVAARREAFTMSIMWGLLLPCDDLANRLGKCVASAIGKVSSDVPWAREMSDDEVDKVFDEVSELGLCPKEGE
jgi:hypothetical protein